MFPFHTEVVYPEDHKADQKKKKKKKKKSSEEVWSLMMASVHCDQDFCFYCT